MTKETINIKPISLEDQKLSQPILLYVELRERCLVYRAKFYADEPKDFNDKELGWENVFNDFEVFCSKDKIAGIERSWMSKSKVWSIYIYISGFASDIKLYFKRESECMEVFNKLKKYLYNEPDNNNPLP